MCKQQCLIIFTIMLWGCDGEGGKSQIRQQTEPPVIRHIGFNLDRYSSVTGLAGDFDFANGNTLGLTDKLFFEFGGDYVWGLESDQHGQSYHFILSLSPEARVVSPIDGVVVNVGYSANWQDSGVGIASVDGADWIVNLDHLLNLTVSVGDQIRAGDRIGNPGNGAVEIDLTYSPTGATYCLFDYFDPVLKSMFEQKIIDLMSDWESYKNNTTLYDESAMHAPGCVVTRVDPH